MLNNIKKALKQNIVPAIYLQITALLVALSYFYLPAAQPYFTWLAHTKEAGGSAYAIISTALFGGLLPFLYLFLSKQISFKPFQQLLFYCLLWAFMGWLIDNFYQFQDQFFGDGRDIATIVKKVMFDQFVFTVLLTAPFLTVSFLFRDKHFNVSETIRALDKKLFLLDLPTTTITNWLIWIPAVSIIYMMPSDLQIPLFNLVLFLFVLILAILNKPNLT